MINKIKTAIILLIFATGDAYSMGKLILFSEVNGVVVKHGAPIEGAIVEQEFDWELGKEKKQLEVKTDANGKFSFPIIMRKSFLYSILPHEPFIRQTILIKYEGNTYKAWLFSKHDYDENGELNGKPISLYCDIEEEPSHHGEIFGICRLL